MRYLRFYLVTVAVALSAGYARAQGVAPGALQEKAVQKELKLTADQSKKIDTFFDSLDAKEREAGRKFAQATEDERRKLMDEMRESTRKQLNEILKPEQFKRLEQIELQRAGIGVFGSPKTQDDLHLTDDQKAKVGSIVSDGMAKIRQSGREMQADAVAATKQREAITNEALTQIVGLLTAEQQAAWKELTGDPFNAPREAPPRRSASSGGPVPARQPEMKTALGRPKATPVPKQNMPRTARRQSPGADEVQLPDGLVGLPDTFIGGNRDRFIDVAPSGGVLVGVNVSYISRFGGNKISSVMPIYRVGEKLVNGKRHGTLLGKEVKAVAKPGYAIGALNTHTGLTVDGFEAVFMRVDGDQLDAGESYNSPWLGDRKGGSPRDVSSEGKVPVGLQGRAGKEVNALGLIVGK